MSIENEYKHDFVCHPRDTLLDWIDETCTDAENLSSCGIDFDDFLELIHGEWTVDLCSKLENLTDVSTTTWYNLWLAWRKHNDPVFADYYDKVIEPAQRELIKTLETGIADSAVDWSPFYNLKGKE